MKLQSALPVIVGTKKVSRAGSVSGLKQMAGRKVLIVAPRDMPRLAAATRPDLLLELGADLRRQGRRALAEYRRLRERHLKTEVPGSRALIEALPLEARPAVRKADAWIRHRALALEKRAARILSG